MNKHVEEQLKKELRAAKARVAELERDQKRMDWLDQWALRIEMSIIGGPDFIDWDLYGRLREAIDAAMPTEEGEGS